MFEITDLSPGFVLQFRFFSTLPRWRLALMARLLLDQKIECMPLHILYQGIIRVKFCQTLEHSPANSLHNSACHAFKAYHWMTEMRVKGKTPIPVKTDVVGNPCEKKKVDAFHSLLRLSAEIHNPSTQGSWRPHCTSQSGRAACRILQDLHRAGTRFYAPRRQLAGIHRGSCPSFTNGLPVPRGVQCCVYTVTSGCAGAV